MCVYVCVCVCVCVCASARVCVCVWGRDLWKSDAGNFLPVAASVFVGQCYAKVELTGTSFCLSEGDLTARCWE